MITRPATEVLEGTLDPLVLKRRDCCEAGVSLNHRRARWSSLTRAGAKQLAGEALGSEWMVSIITRLLAEEG